MGWRFSRFNPRISFFSGIGLRGVPARLRVEIGTISDEITAGFAGSGLRIMGWSAPFTNGIKCQYGDP